MHTKAELDARMQEAGVTPLKQLGQNFLLNPTICQRIVQTAAAFSPRTVVEIGPGLGALTDDLLKTPWTLKLIEMDAGLVEYWNRRSQSNNVQIIHADALKTDWNKLVFEKPAVLVSNLPYSIAASLVVELSSAAAGAFVGLVLMFQKEVAQRIDAKPDDDDYGMLSVLAQSHWVIEKVIDAGPQDFYPVPNVGSRVLKFTSKTVRFNSLKYLSFLKAAFMQRRKKMISNLGSLHKKENVSEALSQLGLNAGVRAQELSVTQFEALFSLLESKKQ